MEMLEKGPRSVDEIAKSLREFFPPQWIIGEKTWRLLRRMENQGLVVKKYERGKIVYRRKDLSIPSLGVESELEPSF